MQHIHRQQRFHRIVTQEGGEERGGRRQVRVFLATAPGTPAWERPLKSVDDNAEARPMVMILKKTPMLTSVPEFWKVERIPDAAPRCSAGTLLITDEVFGEENMPWPRPSMKSRSANQG